MLSKIRKKKLEANIWKFYLYRAFASLMFFAPIFVLFLQENGLSMTQIMILQSVYTIVIMLTVVPSGILADYVGRKRVIVLSTVLYVIGWILYSLGRNFTQFLTIEIIFGISSAMWTASGTAFFYDSLRELEREGSFKKLFGNVITINNVFIGIASLAGAYIARYSNSFRTPFWASAITAFFALLITISFTDTKKYKHGDKHYMLHLKEAIKFAAKHPRIRLFMIYSSIIFSMSFILFMVEQPYFKSIKIPLIYFGWIYLVISLLVAAGSRISNRIEELLGERKILVLLLLIMIGCFFGLSKGLIIIGVIFPMIFAFNLGIFEPLINDYMNKHIESHHRATVLSLGSLLTQIITAVSAPFIGWIIDAYSLGRAFKIAGFILIINLFILIGAFTIIKRREK